MAAGDQLDSRAAICRHFLTLNAPRRLWISKEEKMASKATCLSQHILPASRPLHVSEQPDQCICLRNVRSFTRRLIRSMEAADVRWDPAPSRFTARLHRRLARTATICTVASTLQLRRARLPLRRRLVRMQTIPKTALRSGRA